MRYIDQMDITGKKLLVRVDYNVPMKDGSITDDSRIQASLDTLLYCLNQGAAVILCSHMGKPKGKVVSELSMAPVAKRLEELLEKVVTTASDIVGEDATAKAADLAPGEVLLLENLRFDPGEQKNDPEFSRKLAGLADIYVDDAFGVAHRAHASVVGVTEHAPACCAGLLLKREMDYLNMVVEGPERPYVAISGGAKVSTKLGVLYALLEKVDRIIIGGAMANTFLKAQGYSVGASLVEEDLLDDARMIMKRAMDKGVGFYLPVDFIMGTDPKGGIASGVKPFQDIPDGEMTLDTGPASHALFAEVLKDAKTIIWNGPLGVFENPAFSQGSVGMAHLVAGLDATTIVGGGDTDALIHLCKIEDKFSFISTGGGSFLEYLQGRELPAIKALKECAR
ncbi:MAG: phosphoglycerate kinase [Desulfovibrionales bacterium]